MEAPKIDYTAMAPSELSALRAERDRAHRACEQMGARIQSLEAEVRDLRQRLIGGVNGAMTGRDLSWWATCNDAWLRETAPRIAAYYDPEK